jgi:hypothetical protein
MNYITLIIFNIQQYNILLYVLFDNKNLLLNDSKFEFFIKKKYKIIIIYPIPTHIINLLY